MRNNIKKIKLVLIFTSVGFISFTASNYAVKYISHKIQIESMQMNYLTNNVKFLNDLYTLCMLDFSINPNGKEIKQECEQIKEKIKLNAKYMDESLPYYKIYDSIFN